MGRKYATAIAYSSSTSVVLSGWELDREESSQAAYLTDENKVPSGSSITTST
jgi:hypothetical protein